MKKLFFILGLFIFMASCSTIPSSSPDHQNVIETWSGYATGYGGDCSDANVEVKILEDFSVIGQAHAIEFNMIIRLKGKLISDGGFQAYGSGSGGVSVEYKGSLNGDSASGTWISNRAGCQGTWKLTKNI
ncbi:hypothetical protein ACFL2S_15290 [Thermodesulfobacteriota bacterium]